jgi:NitT/TauT family transport system substrate-binding protein
MSTFKTLCVAAGLAAVAAAHPVQAQTTKFPFRLNWTASGEHAPFFVARDKGFYREEGLEVEILDGSGSTTVLQLAANASSPVVYADAATMMRGVSNGMPVRAVGVPLQQSPHAFIYRADAPRPTKVAEVKGTRIAVTAGDSSMTVFNAFLGKLGLKLEDVQVITVASTAAKDQAVLNKQADALIGFFMDQGVRLEPTTGVKIGYTRLYDLSGVSTLSSAIIANNDWLKDASNQEQLRRFLRASQRGWQYASANRREAAEIFIKSKPSIPLAIAQGTLDGAMTITRTERTKASPIAWSAPEDWKDTQELLVSYAKLKPQPDLNVYFTNGYLSQVPYPPQK